MNQLRSLFSSIEKEHPFGLDYSAIFHTMDAHLTFNLEGKDVLEFGGSLDPSFVNTCLRPSSWHAITSSINDFSDVDQINDSHISHTGINILNRVKSNYIYSEIGLLDYSNMLTATNPGFKFDFVYSTACFEHVDRLHANLSRLSDLLKSHGGIYSYFSPTWEHRSGSHWSRCPIKIPHFSHLFWKPHEMFDFFVNQSISPSSAFDQIYQIFRSPHINRLSHNEYFQIFSNLPDLNVQAHPQFVTNISELESEVASKIKSNYLFDSDFLIGGYRFLAQKK